MTDSNMVYAGFWIRVGAALIDSLVLVLIMLPLAVFLIGFSSVEYINGSPVLGAFTFVQYVGIPVGIMALWVYRGGTPGKEILGLKIVDDKTGVNLTWGQSVGRYVSYYLAMIPVMLGILWVAFDAKKQGWHDKLAGTVVIHK